MVNQINTINPGTPKAIFFDIRDTLGIVDRKGHLVKYQPTTDQSLDAMKKVIGLRISLITNLPADVSTKAEGSQSRGKAEGTKAEGSGLYS